MSLRDRQHERRKREPKGQTGKETRTDCIRGEGNMSQKERLHKRGRKHEPKGKTA
jgi:hypothetical protein